MTHKKNIYKFGSKSKRELASIDVRLHQICIKALSYGVMDFSIIQGYRSKEEQLRAFRAGHSPFDGINKKSKHNYTPSLAVDIIPYPHKINGIDVWHDKQRFSVLAGLMYAAASELEYTIRWGGDWDGDGNNEDSNLHDMPHFELI